MRHKIFFKGTLHEMKIFDPMIKKEIYNNK